MNIHEKYMHRCIQLAANGLGTTYPNPLVGCVIVLDDHIIGEGWHYTAGQPHAEVNAINNAKSAGFTAAQFSKATLYVSLEPCSHHGKTPPCADLVVASGFKNVFIGTLDPHDKVAGNGVEKLQDARITTTVGLLSGSCNALNKRFFTFHKQQRPYIILKWAETADGFIAPIHKNEQKPVWITNDYSRQHVHKTRAQEHAILVGAGTAIVDNPSLDVRSWSGMNPKRYVVANRDLPQSLKLIQGNNPAIIIEEQSPKSIVSKLFEHGIQSVIIEGGSKTIQAFIDSGLWDEAHIYTGKSVLFKEGVAAPKLAGRFELSSSTVFTNDLLNVYKKA